MAAIETPKPWEVIRGKLAGDAFRNHRDTLLTAVTDIHFLANSLYSKKLISQERLQHAQLPALTPNEKKVHLFDAIEARLRSNPDDFVTLIDILNSDPLLQIFAQEIQSSYYNICEGLLMWFPWCSSYLKVDGNVEHGDETMENEKCNESDESSEKKGLLSGVRRGIRKLFGAARDMTASFIKSTLNVLKLDIKIFRRYKKRFDKHTNREQVRWWFEIWGDESALKVLESKWEEVSAEKKWRLETCRAQRG